MEQTSAADCAVAACSASTPPYCVSGTPPLLHICDSNVGFYTAIASSSLIGDPVVVTGSLAISGDGSAGSIDLEEASPGTNVGTLTVGTLAADRTYTLPDINGTVVLYSAAGSLYVQSGARVIFEGLLGDTYITRDPDTGYFLVTVDNAVRATITPRGVIAGACGTNLWATELGTACSDSQGRRIFVGADGPAVLTGTVP